MPLPALPLPFAPSPPHYNTIPSGTAPPPLLQLPCAGPEAAAIPADAYAKHGAAVVQFFEGYGLLPRLATGTNQLMFIGWVGAPAAAHRGW